MKHSIIFNDQMKDTGFQNNKTAILLQLAEETAAQAFDSLLEEISL